MKRSKRIVDITLALVGLTVCLPIFIVISVCIKLDDGGPVFFMQERVGRGGKLFNIVKFRTMRLNADRVGPAITIGADPRITRVGSWLRKTKLDELPQLWNVLVGQMSFVGPRPEVPQYVRYYNSEQRKVLNLVPGITDPASIKYRNESEILAQSQDPIRTYVEQIMPDKIKINLQYARTATIWTDLKLIVVTVLVAFGLMRNSVLVRQYN